MEYSNTTAFYILTTPVGNIFFHKAQIRLSINTLSISNRCRRSHLVISGTLKIELLTRGRPHQVFWLLPSLMPPGQPGHKYDRLVLPSLFLRLVSKNIQHTSAFSPIPSSIRSPPRKSIQSLKDSVGLVFFFIFLPKDQSLCIPPSANVKDRPNACDKKTRDGAAASL